MIGDLKPQSTDQYFVHELTQHRAVSLHGAIIQALRAACRARQGQALRAGLCPALTGVLGRAVYVNVGSAGNVARVPPPGMGGS